MSNLSLSWMLEYIARCAAHETVECLCQGEYWAQSHDLGDMISNISEEMVDTEARDEARAAFPPYIQDVLQVKKISVLTVISIGTLVSNLVILVTILTRQGKVFKRMNKIFAAYQKGKLKHDAALFPRYPG